MSLKPHKYHDARKGVGRNRQPGMIRDWLKRKGYRVKDLAAELGVSHTVVSNTIGGRENNRRVLRCLRDLGCPTRFLALPDDLREGAAGEDDAERDKVAAA